MGCLEVEAFKSMADSCFMIVPVIMCKDGLIQETYYLYFMVVVLI